MHLVCALKFLTRGVLLYFLRASYDIGEDLFEAQTKYFKKTSNVQCLQDSISVTRMVSTSLSAGNNTVKSRI